jgi:hypothetical protein
MEIEKTGDSYILLDCGQNIGNWQVFLSTVLAEISDSLPW